LEKMGVELDNPPAGQHRKIIGQIIIDGRAITNIIQNLRGKEPNFNEWYQPYVNEMQNDELLRFLYKVRSAILKEGDDYIDSIGGRLDSRRHYISISDKGVEIQMRLPNGHFRHELIPKPKNAKYAFLHDSEGGCGWVVENEDGTEFKHYVQVPGDMYLATFKFRAAPSSHRSKNIKNLRAEEMCKLYISYLRDMVHDALNRFEEPPIST
jgi:hypothetical protein